MAKVFWSDVGNSLGLSKSTMKDINKKFGHLLGVTPSNKVPKSSLRAISMIATMQEQGMSDDEIREALVNSKSQSGWPDIVLNRIQEQAAPSATPAALQEITTVSETANHSWLGCLDTIVQSNNRESALSVQDMILDLRREICTNTISEREQIQRLTQVIERLIIEVRDLKYALIMASSRKDRKKGRKGLSRLLHH